jgi:hypothetical protein
LNPLAKLIEVFGPGIEKDKDKVHCYPLAVGKKNDAKTISPLLATKVPQNQGFLLISLDSAIEREALGNFPDFGHGHFSSS